MIAFWAKGENASFDFLIKPRNGFTRRLFDYAKEYKKIQNQTNKSDFYYAIFNKPHSLSAPIGDYRSVFIIATDFKIMAQLPYLKKLIRDFNRCQIRTRRIYFI